MKKLFALAIVVGLLAGGTFTTQQLSHEELPYDGKAKVTKLAHEELPYIIKVTIE